MATHYPPLPDSHTIVESLDAISIKQEINYDSDPAVPSPSPINEISGESTPAPLNPFDTSILAVTGDPQDAERLAKRKRPHTPKACNNCRRRKAKCSGGPPTCRTCDMYNDSCNWNENGDGRKPKSRQHQQAMQVRIDTLEEQLRILRSQGPGVKGGGSGVEKDDQDEDQSIQGIEAVARGKELANNLLERLNGTTYHGYPSAHHHSLPRGEVSLAYPSTLAFAPNDARRYLALPPSIPMTLAQHDTTLSRFFNHFAGWSLAANPIAFQADMTAHTSQCASRASYSLNLLPRDSLYSPFLHNIILSIGLSCADAQGFPRNSDAMRKQYLKRAEEWMGVELERPVLATVQALMLLSSLHILDGKKGMGWAVLGMAEKVSQALGLHIDCASLTGVKMTASEVQRRNQVFWSLFIHQQFWAMYMGLPSDTVTVEHNIPLPEVDASLDSIPFEPLREATHGVSPWSDFADLPFPMDETLWSSLGQSPQAKPKTRQAHLGAAFQETAKLVNIMRKVMDQLYAVHCEPRGYVREEAFSSLAYELDTWNEELPASLIITGHSTKNSLPHILLLQLTREWLTILIYRPCYRLGSAHLSRPSSSPGLAPAIASAVGSSITAEQASIRCDRSIKRILKLLVSYHDLHGLIYCPPIMISIIFTTGEMSISAAGKHPSPQVKMEYMAYAETCKQYLKVLGQRWKAAEEQAGILEGLIGTRGVKGELELQNTGVVSEGLLENGQAMSAPATYYAGHASAERSSARVPGAINMQAGKRRSSINARARMPLPIPRPSLTTPPSFSTVPLVPSSLIPYPSNNPTAVATDTPYNPFTTYILDSFAQTRVSHASHQHSASIGSIDSVGMPSYPQVSNHDSNMGGPHQIAIESDGNHGSLPATSDPDLWDTAQWEELLASMGGDFDFGGGASDVAAANAGINGIEIRSSAIDIGGGSRTGSGVANLSTSDAGTAALSVVSGGLEMMRQGSGTSGDSSLGNQSFSSPSLLSQTSSIMGPALSSSWTTPTSVVTNMPVHKDGMTMPQARQRISIDTNIQPFANSFSALTTSSASGPGTAIGYSTGTFSPSSDPSITTFTTPATAFGPDAQNGLMFRPTPVVTSPVPGQSQTSVNCPSSLGTNIQPFNYPLSSGPLNAGFMNAQGFMQYPLQRVTVPVAPPSQGQMPTGLNTSPFHSDPAPSAWPQNQSMSSVSIGGANQGHMSQGQGQRVGEQQAKGGGKQGHVERTRESSNGDVPPPRANSHGGSL